MKNVMRMVFIIVTIMCAINYAISQSFVKTDDNSRQEIEAINNKIEKLYLDENIGSLVSLYAEELTFFPEYKPAIFETKNLRGFFTDWFNTGDIKAYKKQIYTVEIYDQYLLEIGTFNFNYASLRKPQGEYNGKYMILWKRNIGGDLSIVSETFGADKHIEPGDVPYTDVKIPQGNFVGDYSISKQLQAEIEEFNAVVLKAVAEGDGDARAKGSLRMLYL
jgi:ketosteroid isomerase-like protein